MAKVYSFWTHKHLGDAVICTGAVRNVTAIHKDIKFIRPDHCKEVYQHNPDFVTDAPVITPLTSRVQYGTLAEEQKGTWGNCVEGFTRCLCQLLGIDQVPMTISTPLLILTNKEREEAKKWEDAILVNANCQTCTVSKGYPYWQDVIDGLQGHRIIQVGGAEDRDLSPDLRGVEDMRGKTTIRQLFSMVLGCKMVMAPPTSLTNIAGAFHKPQIVVNAAREADVLTGYPNAVHISKYCDACGWGVDSGCVALRWDGNRPCLRPRTVNGRDFAQCQEEIKPERIIDAAKGLLGE